jgi:heavy metal translocating P-type ATPase
MKYANVIVAGGAALGIVCYAILLLVGPHAQEWLNYPVVLVVLAGGGFLVFGLVRGIFRGEFGSDLLAGLSIVTSVLLGEYLAGAIVVLMLSGGEALEDYAMRRASSVLDALAKRMPLIAHKRQGINTVDIPVTEVRAGDEVVVLPHEYSPVDGLVIEGHGSMDESYLTGEPYRISKTPGCEVISGAINGDNPLVIRALRPAHDSRYHKIMKVMDVSRQRRPYMRRMADSLGLLYTPIAVLFAATAYLLSGDPVRFLAVLVVATPCPLIIAIPVAIIGAISWCAKRGIIIKDPVSLERAHICNTLITDKTGTLTVGEPTLVSVVTQGVSEAEALQFAASLERYSKHPLAQPVLEYARERGIVLSEVEGFSEVPGFGVRGVVRGSQVAITGRRGIADSALEHFGSSRAGLECVVQQDGVPVALFRFIDEEREESHSFVSHLGPKHNFHDVILLSGDRDVEVRYLADKMGIAEVYSGKTPEEKVAIVEEKTRQSNTLFLGDGINDAPALAMATVGVAFGPRSDITSEAAGAVILEPSLRKVDQFLHISRHLRQVALQSAFGGMLLSIAAMVVAGLGFLPPIYGALTQEAIDLFAVLNALRASSLRSRDSVDMV